MKRAFTLIELVFVIVVIGILASSIIPKTSSTSLHDAATQLISHLRYTQHLAMVDDKFDSNDSIWYKKRWQLKFSKGNGTEDKWSYVIFSDRSGTGNPDPEEVAVNPLNNNRRLTGGSTGASMIHTGDLNATTKMNIGKEYGILDVDFSTECRTGATSKNILFDNLGRPLRGNSGDYTSSYDSTASKNILIEDGCTITICSVSDCATADNDEKIVIVIESETGYVHQENL